MVLERETKERFVKMLFARQIIVIQCYKGTNRKTYDYKFIGANDFGRWDFTPLVADYSGYPNNSNSHIQRLSIRALDAASVIADTLYKLKEEKIFDTDKNGYSLYQEVRDLLCTFYI